MSTAIPKARFGDIAIKNKFTNIKGIVRALEKQIRDQAKGKESLLGDNIVSLKLITKSQQAFVLNELAMYPRQAYPIDTIFGKSLQCSVVHKQAVGQFVSKNHTFIKDGSHLFLAEGTHTFYLFLAIVRENRHVSIVTNNLAIAAEYTLRPGKISRLKLVSSGIANTQYGALFELNDKHLDRELEYSIVFISAPSLNPGVGPCTNKHLAEVKRKALESATCLTMLCHYHNLCQDPSAKAPILPEVKRAIWRKRLQDSFTWIVTTPHPNMPSQELKKRPDKRTPQTNTPPHSWQLYSQNCRRLYGEMGDRFIEVQTNGQIVNYE
jgi:DeoR/GlpR family transcriptional regulator of sugar metabolism